MNENVTANIKQILTSFDNFLLIYENPNWVKTATVEDIKISFKLGAFIEKTISNFKSKDSLHQFMNTINVYWKSKNRETTYSKEIFEYACDSLLKNFFQMQNISENILDISIRMYTSLFPKERLEKVLKELILTASSLEAIFDFVKVNENSVDQREIEYQVILTYWSNSLEPSKIEIIKKEIGNYLSLYKVETSLQLLVGMISLEEVSETECEVQKLILDSLLEKMLDRSVLSKIFWLTLLKSVDKTYISKACKNFKDFLMSLFNFIVYIGSMMESEDCSGITLWKSDPNISLCPEISYSDLLSVIRHLYQINLAVKDYVTERLNEAKEFTDSLLWDQVKLELNL